jgi:Spy/CpxP family protein refolding chaperone
MRRLAVLCLAVAVVALAAPDVRAQGRKGGGRFGRGGGFGPLALAATQKSVQEELKLSEEQVTKLKDAAEQQRGSFKGFKDLSKEERQQKAAERAKAADKALAGILNPNQYKRLKQISLQLRGADALADPTVAEAIKLSDDQKEKIKTIREEARNEMRTLFKSDDKEAARQKIADLRKATQHKVLGVLTDEQKTTWKEMTGAPFTGKITPPQRRPRPGAGAGLSPRRLPAALSDRQALPARRG